MKILMAPLLTILLFLLPTPLIMEFILPMEIFQKMQLAVILNWDTASHLT